MNQTNPESQTIPQGFYKKADWKKVYFFSLNFIITAFMTFLMSDLLWRLGYSYLNIILLILFFILIWQISLGLTHSIFGLLSKPKKGKFDHITQTIAYADKDIPLTDTAILIPIYNEETRRVYEGIRTIYTSLKKTGNIEYFDFFILSDSTNPDKWVIEENLWYNLCKQLDAFGSIFYRRRQNNFMKKAGNVADFCKSWGKRYKYMVCLDADSIMSGENIVNLVKIMQKNSGIGICQTAPLIVNSETLFARMMQFSSNFYGPLFQSGLNFWQQGRGNFWGHNAILRVSAFMEHCGLPRLPGREPLGGKILSHDFVEAALMQKAGWAVWLAYDIPGSYEENPPDMIENAVRDRRWCQGNLQHTWLLLSRGFPGTNKIHIYNGIMAYLGSLLWLIFLIVSTLIVYQVYASGLSIITVSGFAAFINMSVNEESLVIFCITAGIIVLPKILTLIKMLIENPRKIKLFGGIYGLITSIIFELIFSTLMAPIQMLFHSKFVLFTLLGKGTGWNPQKRNAGDGISFKSAFKVHWFHTVVGLVWGYIAVSCNYEFFWWMSPILISLVFSIPISIILSKKNLGNLFKKLKIFMTPPETSTIYELETLEQNLASDLLGKDTSEYSKSHYGVINAIIDPYINALHIMMICDQKNIKDITITEPVNGKKLLKEGPSTLALSEIKTILSDPSGMRWLHREVWIQPFDEIHETWKKSILNISY